MELSHALDHSCLSGLARDFRPRCLNQRFDEATLSMEWKEELWGKFVTGAPRPRTLSELQYSAIKSFALAVELGTWH